MLLDILCQIDFWMDVKDMQTKKSRQGSVEQLTNQTRYQPNNDNGTNTIPYLWDLPNELWLLILSYLNIVDIFGTFHGMNQRFDNLIYDCARHVTLPKNVTSLWVKKYMPQLEYSIQTICLNDRSLQYVFTNKWSLSNLRLINLEGDGWNISLKIREEPLLITLMSSLNFLQNINLRTNTCFTGRKNGNIDDENNHRKILSCPFIERLSIDICSERYLYIIRTRIPHLTHLKINYLMSDGYDVHLINESDLIQRTTRLVTLDITTNKIHSYLLEQLVESFKAFLKNLRLNVCSFDWIDGYHLEKIFKSCRQLEKLVFIFQYNDKKVNIDDCRRSFQSEWWLDARRPAVYIQHKDDGSRIVASMPCQFSFTFENNLYHWCVNKWCDNTSIVRFTNTNIIHLTNNIHQSINLEYLYSIDRVFPSSNQSLCFDFCDLELVDILFYMLMDDPSMTPVLPNVKHFVIGSQKQIGSLMLCVWSLLMPNLQKLDISSLTTFNKTELAKELTDMIDDYERLKPSFDHINELIIFSPDYDADTNTKNELVIAFQKVFVKADIR